MPSPQNAEHPDPLAHFRDTTAAPGHCIFSPLAPKWPKDDMFAKIDGRSTVILQAEVHAAGKFTGEDVRYGRILECGWPTARSTCEPLSEEQALLYADWKPGAFLTVRQSLTWKITPNEHECNTFEILRVEKQPAWAPQ